MSDVHGAAQRGFSVAAAAYVSGRPDYPAEIFGWLESDLGLRPGDRVLDLGAGTGKFSACLNAFGLNLTAVEPVEAMREAFSRAVPGFEALPGSATEIPARDSSFACVFCAQSFHWFANERALSEIGRVLKPGGALGLVWNVRDESVAWVAQLARILAPYQGDTPRYGDLKWRRLFPADGFGPLRERRFSHLHRGPVEAVIVERVLSTSFIATRSAAEREKVAARTRELMAATPELMGGEEVRFPYITFAYDCRKQE